MQTIAIMNQKGGVAKTVTTVNVAAILAVDHHKRVLVVDADSQANATEFFLGSTQDVKTGLADLLRMPKLERTPFSVAVRAEQATWPTTVRGLDLLPADDSLMDLDLSKATAGEAYVECLRDLLAGSVDGYDYVLIDCPPAFNAAAAAALVAADRVLIPIKLDAFSLRGMTNILRQISNMRKINPRLTVAELLPVMWYRSAEIQEAEKVLRGSGLPVYPHIRRSNKVDDMTFRQEPLIWSSPQSGACKDYRQLVRQLVQEGGARHG